MNLEDLEELVRKYLSTGVAVVVILVAPGTGATTGETLPSEPSITLIEPDGIGVLDTGAGGAEAAGSTADADDRTGAAGRDPDRSGDPEQGSDVAGGTDPESGDSASGDSASGRDSRDGTAPAAGSGDEPSGNTAENAQRVTDGSADEGSTAAGGADHPGDGSRNRSSTGDTRDGNPIDTSTDDENAGNTSENDSSENDSSENDTGQNDTGENGSGENDSGENDMSTDTGSGRGSSDSAAESSAAERSGTDATGSDADAGTTAAARHGWGTPDREDDFSSGAGQWDIYDGPGHGGEGRRSPSAVSVRNGVLTITGDSSGTTAGMAWNPGQKYGRWEGRVRAPVSDPSYNALLLLWPDAEDFPVGGEIDFMEMMDHTRQKTDIFIHYGEDNSQVNGSVEVDGTEWHNWALEWTPEAITAFVDGEEWYRTTDTSIFPPGPMHLCIQLDWFPEGDTPKESIMEVDWVRQYSLDGDASGDSATSAQSGAADHAEYEGTGASGAGRRESEDGDDEESPVRGLLRRLFSWR